MESISQVEFCAECRLELPKGRESQRRLGKNTLCICCFDMWDAISGNGFMVDAQDEYQAEQKRRNILKPGGKYLD